MSDQHDVVTPTSQHKTQKIDIHAPGGIPARNPSMRVAADPHLRPRGHSFRLIIYNL